MITTDDISQIETKQRSALHYDPTVPQGGSHGPEVADLLMNRSAIAFEGLKTQWTAILELGTHERMALSQLWIYGPMQMSELAARISLSRAAVTTLIDRLEAGGWLRRANDPTDRRRTILHLEPYAIKRRRESAREFEREIRTWALSLPEEEWNGVRKFLDHWFEVSTRQTDVLRNSVPPR